MIDTEELRQQLQQAYKVYMQSDDHEQHTALQLVAVLLQKNVEQQQRYKTTVG